MEFEHLLEIVGDEPIFETGLLLAGEVDPDNIRRQLSRWTKARRLYQLRRGLYALAPPYQKVKPHPFTIANRMVRGSYVSSQSALSHYGLIPEVVPVVTSVTASRRGQWETELGNFLFRHIKPELLLGYVLLQLGGGQQALVAKPEKALMDLIYLTPNGDSDDYLRTLRLQNLESLDLEELWRQVKPFNRPKLRRAADIVETLVREEAAEYKVE